jgi:hypothetical protein
VLGALRSPRVLLRYVSSPTGPNSLTSPSAKRADFSISTLRVERLVELILIVFIISFRPLGSKVIGGELLRSTPPAFVHRSNSVPIQLIGEALKVLVPAKRLGGSRRRRPSPLGGLMVRARPPPWRVRAVVHLSEVVKGAHHSSSATASSSASSAAALAAASSAFS